MAKKKQGTKTASSLYGNYNDFLTGRLTKLHVKPGDLIRIQQGTKKIEGNLLSQSDMGDPSTLLVKLDNGYNIGIKVDTNVEINKLEGSVDLEAFNVNLPSQKKNLPKISLFGTGGTIASRIDYQTGGVVMAMEPEEIFVSLPELFDEVSFKSVKSLFTLASEDLAHKQWVEMSKNTAEAINGGVNGVVLSHGTDTLGYSAAAMSFMLPDLSRPVVLTGAQRSADRGSFDGAFNLISAARVAANSDIAAVMVAMHSSSNDDFVQLSRGTNVRKMHTTRRDAFKTINDTPLAKIDMDGKITELQPNLPRTFKGTIDPLLGYEDKVALVKIFPGINPELIDFYIDKNYKGLIIEGTGLGHVPTYVPDDEQGRNFMKGVQRGIEEGMFVGMTSQCLNGRVHPFVYRNTRTAYSSGVIYLEDMIPETALVKLGWALGNFEEDEIKEKMITNMAGEISPRSFYQEYE